MMLGVVGEYDIWDVFQDLSNVFGLVLGVSFFTSLFLTMADDLSKGRGIDIIRLALMSYWGTYIVMMAFMVLDYGVSPGISSVFIAVSVGATIISTLVIYILRGDTFLLMPIFLVLGGFWLYTMTGVLTPLSVILVALFLFSVFAFFYFSFRFKNDAMLGVSIFLLLSLIVDHMFLVYRPVSLLGVVTKLWAFGIVFEKYHFFKVPDAEEQVGGGSEPLKLKIGTQTSVSRGNRVIFPISDLITWRRGSGKQ